MALLGGVHTTSAVACWSTIKSRRNFAAVGESSKVSIYDFSPIIQERDDKAAKVIGTVNTTSTVNTVAWGSKGPSVDGLLAVGEKTGVVNIYDPASLISKSSAQPLTRVTRHKEEVICSEFSSVEKGKQLLATGGKNDEVFVIDLKNASSPSVFNPNSAQKTQPNIQESKSFMTTNCLAWNSQVAHVLATGSSSGTLNVWDLRQKTAWCTLRDSRGSGFSQVRWNPVQGLYIMTATEDELNPVLRLWDLRSSTTQPLTEFAGHHKSIVAFDWCCFDEMIVSSVGKDDRLLLWDLYSGQVVSDLNDPTGSQAMESSMNENVAKLNISGKQGGLAGLGFGSDSTAAAGDVFSTFNSTTTGSEAATSHSKFVLFSPCSRSLLLTNGNNENEASIFSINSFGSLNYASKKSRGVDVSGNMRNPKWLKKCHAIGFTFGGKFAQILPPNEQKKQNVTVSFITDDSGETFARSAVQLESELATYNNQEKSLEEVCNEKSGQTSDEFSTYFWQVLPLFQTDIESNRDTLTRFLGFDQSELRSEVFERLGRKVEEENQIEVIEETQPKVEERAPGGLQGLAQFSQENNQNAADFFGNASSSFDEIQPHSQDENKGVELLSESIITEKQKDVSMPKKVQKVLTIEEDADVDELVKKCLLLGDFDAGVDVLLANQRFSDALLFGTCGGEELWNKCVQSYLAHQVSQKSTGYSLLMKSIIEDDFSSLIRSYSVSLSNWRECLLVICQYSKLEEFHELCDLIGDSLLSQTTDNVSKDSSELFKAAIVCFLASMNVEKISKCIIDYHSAVDMSTQPRSEKLSFLSDVVEKLLFLNQIYMANNNQIFVSLEAIGVLLNFCEELSQIGHLDYAARFLSEFQPFEISSEDEKFEDHNSLLTAVYALSDRIYGAHPSPQQSLIHFIPQRYFPYQNVRPTRTVVDASELQTNETKFDEPQAQEELLHEEHQDPTYNQAHSNSFNQTAANTFNQQPTNSFIAPTSNTNLQQPPSSFAQPPQQQTQQHFANDFNKGQAPYYNNSNTQFQPQQQQQPSFNSPYEPPQFPSQQAPAPPPGPPTTSQQMQGSQPQPQFPPRSPSPTKKPPPRIPLNDGFGSTVGNPAAGQRYGNFTTGNLDLNQGPNHQVPQQQQQENFQSPPSGSRRRMSSRASSVSNYDQLGNPIPGPNTHNSTVFDPSKNDTIPEATSVQGTTPAIPVQQRPTPLSENLRNILSSFEQLVVILGNFEMSVAEKKYLELGSKSLEVLKQKMESKGISPDLEEELLNLASSLNNYDFNAANQLKLNITRHYWTAQKDWLKGFSQLITLAQKKYPNQ